MPTARIGSDEKHLQLTAQPWPTEGHENPVLKEAPNQRFLKAELRHRQLTATHTVDLPRDLCGLDDYFADASANWRDWDEARGWTSREGDLSIAARLYQGQVRVHVTLRDLGAWRTDEWTVTAELTIQPGDDLRRIAGEVSRLKEPLT